MSKISELAEGAPLAVGDLLVVARGSGNKKITVTAAMAPQADATGADVDTTMVANTRYDVDTSAWAADRTYTLPTTATVGDEIDVYIQIGNAPFAMILKTGAGQTCAFAGSTVGAATEITRLFITGERMRFRYQATNKWECVLDKRIRMTAVLRLSTTATSETAATFVYATSQSGAWAADVDVGGVVDTSTGRINFKRACLAHTMIRHTPAVAVADQKYFGCLLEKNGTVSVLTATSINPVSEQLQAEATGILSFAASDYVRHKYRSQEGSKGALSHGSIYYTTMQMMELF